MCARLDVAGGDAVATALERRIKLKICTTTSWYNIVLRSIEVSTFSRHVDAAAQHTGNALEGERREASGNDHELSFPQPFYQERHVWCHGSAPLSTSEDDLCTLHVAASSHDKNGIYLDQHERVIGKGRKVPQWCPC